jgi:tRNA threonylcarbamoyladenosine biosynthesis protein TsaE
MFISRSAVETEAIGERLAQGLQSGDALALSGEVGAGKTQLVKGIARGLGYIGAVTSPTFNLVHEYRGGRLPLYHLDWYRLENIEALRDIGFEEYGDGVCVIEWADKFDNAIPPHSHGITIRIASSIVRIIDHGRLRSPLPAGGKVRDLR